MWIRKFVAVDFNFLPLLIFVSSACSDPCSLSSKGRSDLMHTHINSIICMGIGSSIKYYIIKTVPPPSNTRIQVIIELCQQHIYCICIFHNIGGFLLWVYNNNNNIIQIHSLDTWILSPFNMWFSSLSAFPSSSAVVSCKYLCSWLIDWYGLQCLRCHKYLGIHIFNSMVDVLNNNVMPL